MNRRILDRGGARRAFLCTCCPWIAGSLLTAAAGGCAPTRTIAGFPNQSFIDYAPAKLHDAAQKITGDIRSIRSLIDDPRNPDAPSRTANHAIYNALLALSNDHAAYRILSSEYEHHILEQVLPPTNHSPLQLYPRLTHPHISAALPALEKTNIQESGEQSWFVPLVLSRRALLRNSPTRFESFLTRTREVLGADKQKVNDRVKRMLEKLAFFLQSPNEQQRWIGLPRPTLSGICTEDGSFNLALPDSSAVSLVFALPVGASTDLNHVTPGFYWIRTVPRLRAYGGAYETDVGKALESGEWWNVRELLPQSIESAPAGTARDLRLAARSIVAYAGRIGWGPGIVYFQNELDSLARGFRRAANIVSREGTQAQIALTTDEIKAAIDALLRDESPAPVLLDSPHRCAEFSFIVAGDIQLHRDERFLHRFLSIVNGAPDFAEDIASLSAETRRRIEEAKFVILVGDLADGGAGSSDRVPNTKFPSGVLWNSLGILPPTSPYTDDPGEFKALKSELRRSSKPVFATPGNHDGMVGYGGILSFYLDASAELANEFHLVRDTLARIIFAGNNFIPNGVKLHIPSTLGLLPRQSGIGSCITPSQQNGPLSWFFTPRYDGLIEWRWHLGPLNVLFNYRGCSFVGLNTYNLSQPDRAGVGPVVFNWGGGVQPRDVVWLNAMLTALREDPLDDVRHQFLFMHHDPRGLTPVDASNCHDASSDGQRSYDATDAWGNYLTAGYAGLTYSPAWGLYIPVLTPLVDIYLLHLSQYVARRQQEWMQGYGARALIDVINNKLVSWNVCKDTSIFFAHNDLPLKESWNGSSAPKGEAAKVKGVVERWIRRLFLKTRTYVGTETSTTTKHVSPRGSAKVLRLDDIGSKLRWDQSLNKCHGFHVVTVQMEPEISTSVDPVCLDDEGIIKYSDEEGWCCRIPER